MGSVIGRGFATFAGVLIAHVLFKLFGQPLIDAIPSGTWGLQWLLGIVAYLGTVDALFWFVALGLVLLVLLFHRTAWLTVTSYRVVTASYLAAVFGGGWYRLAHMEVVINVAADPAFWILVAGFLAPFAAWAIKQLVEDRMYRRELNRRPPATARSTASTIQSAS